jgi:hypothetical protein
MLDQTFVVSWLQAHFFAAESAKKRSILGLAGMRNPSGNPTKNPSIRHPQNPSNPKYPKILQIRLSKNPLLSNSSFVFYKL